MNLGRPRTPVFRALRGFGTPEHGLQTRAERRQTHLLRLALAAALVMVFLLPGRTTRAALPPLEEISYYPRNHAWLQFWADWPATALEMDEDMHLIRALGANTVRFFVHPNAFNYPDLPTSAQLDRFEEALALVDAHGLQAHVTLFDCWWSWHEIEASRAWLAAIVGPYRDDPRIAAWELQNEVDLSQQVVRDWVQTLFPDLKGLAGDTPCTVSVFNVEWLKDVQDLTAPATPDLYSLHWYPALPLTWTTPLTATLQRAKELVGVDKLLLGEFGIDTYRVSETTQADLYHDVLHTAHQQGIVHLGQWTLYDFPEGTAQCDPATPAPAPELHFGLYRLDGSPKPAAQILRDAFHGRFPSSPSPAIVRNPSFEGANPSGGRLDDWYPWDEQWTGRTWFDRDCSEARSGNCSVRVQGVPTMTVGLYNAPALPIEHALSAARDRRYSLEGYAKTAGLEGEVRLVFSWSGADEQWLNQDTRSEPLTGTHVTEWTRLHIDDVEPPPQAAYVQVFAQVSSTHPLSWVWFDDITTLVERVHLPLVQR